MKRRPSILWVRNFVAALATISIASCSPEEARPARDQSQDKWVVLSITEFTGGMIKGSVPCTDDAGREILTGPCFSTADILMSAVFGCGPSIVTIDRSWTHTEFVSFPVNQQSEQPSDLEVVQCVQRKVGFRFSAAIGEAPKLGEHPGTDSSPFAPLQSEPEMVR